MNDILRTSIAAGLLCASFSASNAADTVALGQQMSIEACSSCHQVTQSQTNPAAVFDTNELTAVVAPPFLAIARKYGDRPDTLREIITEPRHPMKQQLWNEKDLESVIAYIQSLAKKRRKK